MITTWPTHEEPFPKMPCGRRKLNASCKRTRYKNGEVANVGRVRKSAVGTIYIYLFFFGLLFTKRLYVVDYCHY